MQRVSCVLDGSVTTAVHHKMAELIRKMNMTIAPRTNAAMAGHSGVVVSSVIDRVHFPAEP